MINDRIKFLLGIGVLWGFLFYNSFKGSVDFSLHTQNFLLENIDFTSLMLFTFSE